MDEQERLMNRAWPGEIHSIEVAAEGAPALGARLRLQPGRPVTADEPEGLGFDPDPDGPWTVFAIRPSDGDSARATVLMRKL